ncbi:MAG: Rieske 2Fe-2S domain-containing protein, partial [Propionivibrio sp.]
MATLEWGKRDAGGEWAPEVLPKPGALFAWPWNLRAALKSAWSTLWPFNLIYMVIAVITWLYFTPSLETTKNFEFGWIALIYLRDVVLLTLVAGGLHLRLYALRGQGKEYKYNDQWLAEKNKDFLFGNQTWDNIFWSLTSGCLVWTAYEAVTLWAFSNGIIPYVDFREHPIYGIFMLWAIVYIRFAHFFFVHWASHWKPLFNASHYLHHRNINIGPWSGMSMHPIEHIIYLSGVLIHWVIPSHPVHAMFHMMHAAISPPLGHTGFHQLVRGKARPLNADAYFHYVHHKYFNCNYGNEEVPLDWWFKTYNDGTASPNAVRKEEISAKNEIPGFSPELADSWLEVCDSAQLRKEAARRFDFDGRSFALYRTADHRTYATDGFCTHGNEHLAQGRVKGDIIECAKHHGTFNVRDGSPLKLPVCVGLKTYETKEENGKLWVNLTTAGGAGLAQAALTHRFRVVSNDNVASFIKELVVEPIDDATPLVYQPGDYLQFDIPAYANKPLGSIDVGPRYTDLWQAQKTFDAISANASACRRNYSLASNPAIEKPLRFNVRLALPPIGQACPVGAGSAYVFGLRPGDEVSAIGPFGDFHIRAPEADREMVYIGGGAGMAPLRAHLSHLLETLHSTRKISYWYGARAMHDVFYQPYFEQLASEHANFGFHVALSEPATDDQWTSHTGFIHEVVARKYLARHPDPTSIDYYLCGPPAMITATTAMLSGLGV